MQQKFTQRFFEPKQKPASDDVELAYSNPSFENIGLLYIDLEFPVGGRISHPCGSAVYIGGRFLITAAHCVQKTREITAISCFDYPLIKPVGFTFKRINQDGTVHSEYQIEQEFIHPEYDSKALIGDLALFKLTSKIEHLSGFQVLPESDVNFEDCTAVGFGMKGARDEWFMSRDGLKRAFTPQVFPSTDNFYNSVNGYELHKSHSGFHLEKNNEGPLASGLTLGMSGGGLINKDNQLLGITSQIFTPNDELFREFNPLETEQFKQSKWLSQTFSEFSAVSSYISPIPVMGLNPVTGMGNKWVNINGDFYRNWLITTMELHSSPEEYSELSRFHSGNDLKECRMM